MLRRSVIYVQVCPGYFVARLHGDMSSTRVECQALSHPRTLAGDFRGIEVALKGLIKSFWTFRMWFLKPDMLLHFVQKVDGGYTNIELRAFKDAAESAGARMGWLCTDKYGPLTDEQLVEVFGG